MTFIFLTRLNELAERIEKLEHDRDAMQNWGKQFDFMHKQSFESIELFKDKPTNEPKHSEPKLPCDCGECDCVVPLECDRNIEIERLKSEVDDTETDRRILMKIIEQALEQVSIEETTERTGTLINGIKTVQIDVMEFYKILSKFKDILEGST